MISNSGEWELQYLDEQHEKEIKDSYQSSSILSKKWEVYRARLAIRDIKESIASGDPAFIKCFNQELGEALEELLRG